MFYFIIANAKLLQSERAQQHQLIELTNAFTKAYAQARADDGVVPAAFRRIGMEHFGHEAGPSSKSWDVPVSIRMPGVPGLELETVEKNRQILAYIRTMADSGMPRGKEEIRLEQGQVIARKIVPSFASGQSCVSCHNEALGFQAYALGDVMGAFVIETDLTKPVIQNAYFALGAFFVILFAALLVVGRENQRMQSAVDALKGRVKAESYANFLASHDSLTDLPNRKLFLRRLNADVAAFHKGTCENVITVIIDVDDFKTINDTLGHDAGDAVLKRIGISLRSVFERYGGLAARLGGDEFAGVLKVCPGGLLPEDLGSELLDELCLPFAFKGASIQPGVSIGVAGLEQLTETGSRQLLKAADIALYAAKRGGKRCSRVFDSELRRRFGRLSGLTSALPDAICDGSVSAILQPQVDVSTHQLVGFEALARWTHEGQVISPAEFIPIAEEIGLIGQLDLAVLKRAIALVQPLMKTANRQYRLSVNVSAKDFKTDAFVHHIQHVLHSSGFDPHLLTLEITESVFLEDWSAACARLELLQNMGLKIALDDFGTGYSSLSYLMQFSFDIIKIDRTFLQRLEEDRARLILLNHIIKLATNLGKTVVAEGVERPDQAMKVSRLGAHVLQGALFGLDIEDAPELLVHSDRKSGLHAGATR
ncbi:MAG: EAL domain-containing protein [Pseudomonadota bacterium]